MIQFNKKNRNIWSPNSMRLNRYLLTLHSMIEIKRSLVMILLQMYWMKWEQKERSSWYS